MSSIEQPPTLPTELERQIFEIAASIHPTLLSLPIVLELSAEGLQKIEPLLYQVQHSEYTLRWTPVQTIRDLIEERLTVLRDYDRRLALSCFETKSAGREDILRVLAACDATINLQLYDGRPFSQTCRSDACSNLHCSFPASSASTLSSRASRRQSDVLMISYAYEIWDAP
ncbi:hypothetical protein C8R44DRAFT_883086 [Mycena epipterygia]|nr:hypothetical protein C8R44DRAFT_883086 [Mycena epipterygia]